MSKILIIDDDDDLLEMLHAYFSMHGYVAETCRNGEDAIQLLANFYYDIIVLDWGLPTMSGAEVCRHYRKSGGQTPIVFLTGMEDVAYLEEGLDAGADDYVSKPFDIRALAARVKGLLKRRTGAIVSELRIGNLMLKPETSSISNGTEEVRLTVKEAALLTYLMRHPNRLFSAQQLLDAVWPSDGSGSTDSVRTWMNLLRRKLARLDEQNLIKTVIGSGYIIETADKKTDKTADKKS